MLSFVSEAAAEHKVRESYLLDHSYKIKIGKRAIGFSDARLFRSEGDLIRTESKRPCSIIHLGPLGVHEVPFTATQGLGGFCLFTVLLVILPAGLAVRWKRKRAT
jgi:hypothetical protein